MSTQVYTDAIFHSVELSTTEFKSTDAVSKSYVDAAVVTAVAALIDNAPSAMDTLKELGAQITAGSSAADAITSSLSTVQVGLANEIAARASSDATSNAAIATENARAVAAESLLSGRVTTNYDAAVYGFTDLDTRLAAEATARLSMDTALHTNQLAHHESMVLEQNNRLADDQVLRTQISLGVSALEEEKKDRTGGDTTERTRAQTAQTAEDALQYQVDQKLAVSSEYQKRDDGALQVSYLYISDVWRLGASTAIGSKRLAFEYSPDGGSTWQNTIPFIRPV